MNPLAAPVSVPVYLILAALAIAMLAGCDGASPEGDQPDARISCRPEGGERVLCRVERDGDVLVLHKPDGGFRRLRITNGALVAADGAEPARIGRSSESMLLVEIGSDRFDLPEHFAR